MLRARAAQPHPPPQAPGGGLRRSRRHADADGRGRAAWSTWSVTSCASRREVRRQLVNRGPAALRLLALGGYVDHEHEPRDAEAFNAWDETEPGTPQTFRCPTTCRPPNWLARSWLAPEPARGSNRCVEPGVDRLAQRVAHEVEGDHGHHDQDARPDTPPTSSRPAGTRSPGRASRPRWRPAARRPKPRKLSVASRMIASATWKVALTTSVPSVFGSRWRTISARPAGAHRARRLDELARAQCQRLAADQPRRAEPREQRDHADQQRHRRLHDVAR